MKRVLEFLKVTILGGVVVILPMAAAMLLSLRMLAALEGTVDPIATQLPFGGPAVRDAIAVVLILLGCFVTGLVVRTQLGRRANAWLERTLLERLPAYGVLRSLGKRVAGEDEGINLAPALAEIEDALVPAFIVERHDDGRFTVFVPAVPTPTVGAVYILPPTRVHPLDVPLTALVACVTRWGTGSRELVAAMSTRAT